MGIKTRLTGRTSRDPPIRDHRCRTRRHHRTTMMLDQLRTWRHGATRLTTASPQRPGGLKLVSAVVAWT